MPAAVRGGAARGRRAAGAAGGRGRGAGRAAVAAGPSPAAATPTVCEETPLPWELSTPLEARLGEAHRRASELGAAAFAPFDLQTAAADEIGLCLRWPDVPSGRVPAPRAPYPAVPALILQGGEDLRTPPEGSARVAAGIPGAERVVVPGVGHAVVGGRSERLRPAGAAALPRRPAGRRRLPAGRHRRAGGGAAAGLAARRGAAARAARPGGPHRGGGRRSPSTTSRSRSRRRSWPTRAAACAAGASRCARAGARAAVRGGPRRLGRPARRGAGVLRLRVGRPRAPRAGG